jgi:hypothetical protein
VPLGTAFPFGMSSGGQTDRHAPVVHPGGAFLVSLARA